MIFTKVNFIFKIGPPKEENWRERSETMVGFTERDIDDLTDIYINKVIYPSDEEKVSDDDDGETNIYSKNRPKIMQMPKSIYVTKV